MSETELIEVAFPDDGPTSPINTALALQDVVDAARALRSQRSPEAWYWMLDALAAYEAIEELL